MGAGEGGRELFEREKAKLWTWWVRGGGLIEKEETKCNTTEWGPFNISSPPPP